MKQRLNVYIFLISLIFIIVYFASEYFVRRLDEGVEIYNQRINILYNAHEVVYRLTAIQEGLYSLLYSTSEDPELVRVHLKKIEDGIENLGTVVGYIFYAGSDDDLFRVYSHHVEVIENIYPKFARKVEDALMVQDGHLKQRYLKEAIESGKGVEIFVRELDGFLEDEYLRVSESLPAAIEKMKKIRNISSILLFIILVISSIIMFRSSKVYRRILSFIRAIKEGDYTCKVDAGNDECAREVVSAFKMIIDRVKEVEKASESLSITDPLTGVYNRRYFDIRINEEMNRCIRYGTIFSLSLIDIDYFKEVNDTYGHQVGDLVLKELVMLIKENVRDTDIVARYGGEEFVIIYPCTPKAGVLSQVDRLRGIVEVHKFVDLDKPLTISIGAADSAGKSSHEQVIQEADSNLYLAKSKGRNRCVIIGVTA